MTTENKGLPAILDRMEGEFAKALGNTVPASRFIRCAKSTLNANPSLQELDRTSVLASIMKAAQDGLVIDGKEAAIVPFKGKATYIPMVAGLVKKIRQHSKFANISYGIIYQKELDQDRFVYEKGDNERLIHNPILFGDRGEPVGAYAIVTTDDGTKFRSVLRKDQIEKRLAKGQDSANKKEWADEFWLKTAIKAVYKIAPNSGDETGYLDGVFRADDDPGHDSDGVVTATAPIEVTPTETAPKPRTRAAAAVMAQVDDAETIDIKPTWADEDVPV